MVNMVNMVYIYYINTHNTDLKVVFGTHPQTHGLALAENHRKCLEVTFHTY